MTAPTPGHERYLGNIPKFYLFRALVNFQLWMPIWVVYLQEERGLSLTEVTALDAPFWIAIVLLEVPTGVVADRWGRKASMCYGAFIYAGAVFVFGIAGDFPLLLFSYLLWGAAFTLFSGADSAFVYDSLKAAGRESDYQKVFGRSWAIQSAAMVGGLVVGAPLAELTNLWFPVVASSAMLLAAGAVTLTFVEPPRYDEGEEELGLVANTRAAARTAWGTPTIRYVMLLAAAVFAGGAAISILQQPFLRGHDVSVGAMGWFLLPGSVIGIIAALYSHRVVERLGIRTLVMLLPVATMTAAVVLGSWSSLYAFLFFGLASAANAMSHPVLSDYLNRRVRSSQRATVLSFNQLLFSLMLAPLEPLLGAIADSISMMAAYRVHAIIIAVTAAPLLALWLRSLRDEPPAIAIEAEEQGGAAAPQPVGGS